MDTTEPPITEKTKAIQNLRAEVLAGFDAVAEKLSQLQDVSSDVKAIREHMKRQETTLSNRWAAFKRAINQFISQW